MDSNSKTLMEKEQCELNLHSDDSSTTLDNSSLHSSLNSSDFHENSQENSACIKEVYASNLKVELKKIKSIIDKKEFVYIGMDTEFPGTVYQLNNLTNDFYYKTMKLNVNSTKLIQLGITLTNGNGNFPKDFPYHTWQFNFEFDVEKDIHSEESIKLLKTNGINFDKLKEDGINHKQFAEGLKNSALVLNPNVKWVSYQGSYDFAYLYKLLVNENLPDDEKQYLNTLSLYFPKFYDIKMLVKDNDYYFYGGLNKLIANLGIERKGINHQAGSDAIATIEAYHELVDNESINKEKLKQYRNVLYGLGAGKDNENTIKYLKSSNSINFNNTVNKIIINNINNSNVNMNNRVLNTNMLFIQNQKQIQIQQIQQIQMKNCMQNNYVNCFYPCYLMNTYNIIKNNMMLNQIRKCKTSKA